MLKAKYMYAYIFNGLREAWIVNIQRRWTKVVCIKFVQLNCHYLTLANIVIAELCTIVAISFYESHV